MAVKNLNTNIVIICLLVFFAHISNCVAEGDELERLQVMCQKLEATQKAAFEKEDQSVKKAYEGRLKSLQVGAQRDGDLESLLVIGKEIKRFAASSDVTVSDLVKEPAILNKAQQSYMDLICEKKRYDFRTRHNILTSYKSALAGLVVSLTQKDKLEAAVTVRTAVKAVDEEISTMDLDLVLRPYKPLEKIASAREVDPVKVDPVAPIIDKDKVDTDKLVGTWVIYYPGAKGEMTINADGTIAYMVGSGTWKMESNHVLVKRSNGKIFKISRPISLSSSKYGTFKMSKK